MSTTTSLILKETVKNIVTECSKDFVKKSENPILSPPSPIPSPSFLIEQLQYNKSSNIYAFTNNDINAMFNNNNAICDITILKITLPSIIQYRVHFKLHILIETMETLSINSGDYVSVNGLGENIGNTSIIKPDEIFSTNTTYKVALELNSITINSGETINNSTAIIFRHQINSTDSNDGKIIDIDEEFIIDKPV
jgi:hypothetical protein